MKKFIILLNDCVLNFWFNLLLLTSICLLFILFKPYILVMYFNRDQEFSHISSIAGGTLIYFLVLAILSIILSLFIWLKDKTGNSYRGLASLIVTLTSLAFIFIFIVNLSILQSRINGGDFNYPTIGGPFDVGYQKTAK